MLNFIVVDLQVTTVQHIQDYPSFIFWGTQCSFFETKFCILGQWNTRCERFKRDIFYCLVTQKWYKINVCLQWLTDRMLYMIYQLMPISVTLNYPWRRFQGHIQGWISQKRYKIETWLLQTTNGNWYVAYWIVPSSMTLTTFKVISANFVRS